MRSNRHFLILLILLLLGLTAWGHGIPTVEGTLIRDKDGRHLRLELGFNAVVATNVTDGLELKIGGDDGLLLLSEKFDKLLRVSVDGAVLKPQYSLIEHAGTDEDRGLRIVWNLPAGGRQLSVVCADANGSPGICIWNFIDEAGLLPPLHGQSEFGAPLAIDIAKASAPSSQENSAPAAKADAAPASPAAPAVKAPEAGKELSHQLSLWRLIALGFRHILPEGLDHVFFIACLFLLAPRLRPLFWQATIFTLAHSITLALAMSGLFLAPSRWVETLIALSIVCLAIGNLGGGELKPGRKALIFAFGLVHGLGFAGSFAHLSLSKGDLCRTLFGLNFGIECAQIFILCLLGGLVWKIRDKDWFHQGVRIPFSLLIGAIASWWAIERAFGL
ncbi:MAG: hypothetical protein RL095_667 [Verrucomicrobiota bacterium]|jgi:hypothetical protein